MFYLIQFFKTYALSPLKTLFFWVTTILVLLIAILSPEINRQVSDYYNQKNNPYFYALIESPNSVEELIPRLNSIQGIQSLKMESEEEMKKIFSVVMSDLDLDPNLRDQINQDHHVGLKVNLKSENSKKFNEDIKAQVAGIFGSESITTTAIKSNDSSSQGYDSFIYLHAAQIILGLALLFWFLALWSWSEVVRKKAYLIEEFSRKQNVCFKVCLAGLLFFVSLSVLSMVGISQGLKGVLVSVGFFEISTVSLLFVLSSMSFLKKWKWAE
jgi:hypothetical protein